MKKSTFWREPAARRFWKRLLAYALGFGVVYILFTFYFNFDNMYTHLPPLHGGQLGDHFGWPVPRQSLANREADEISGLAPAHGHPHALWGHNDSGDGPRLFLFDEAGADLGTYLLPAMARDWEDMAAGWIDSTYYLFVGDVGDNDCLHEIKYIYRLPEPTLRQTGPGQPTKVDRVDTLRFRYPDGNRDVETLMFDPVSRNLYLVSKRERKTRLYCLPHPQAGPEIITAQLLAELPLDLITSGDISADGREILLKNYQYVYYWQRQDGESVEAVLCRPPVVLPYQTERRGEAIAFAPDGQGYFTLGEDLKKYRAVLYFYPRK
jgi:hypothetical protein